MCGSREGFTRTAPAGVRCSGALWHLRPHRSPWDRCHSGSVLRVRGKQGSCLQSTSGSPGRRKSGRSRRSRGLKGPRVCVSDWAPPRVGGSEPRGGGTVGGVAERGGRSRRQQDRSLGLTHGVVARILPQGLAPSAHPRFPTRTPMLGLVTSRRAARSGLGTLPAHPGLSTPKPWRRPHPPIAVWEEKKQIFL